MAGLAGAAPAEAVSSFTVVPSPNPGTANTLGGLVSFGPGQVWAVGASSSPNYAGCKGRTLAAAWNGSAFGQVPDPNPVSICATVNGAGGTSTSDVWGVGSTGNGRATEIRHFNGAAWSDVPGAVIPTPSVGVAQRTTGLNGIVTLASDDAWAVGRAEFADFTRHTLAEHWNGSAWSLLPSPTTPGSALNAVTAAGPALWAVGNGGGATLITRWNGTAFAAVPSPSAAGINTLRGVSGTSASDVWAVGSSNSNPNNGVSTWRTLIEHFNGTSWSIVPSPNVGTGDNQLLAVAARGPADAYAVGSWLNVTGSIPVLRTLVLHWDGAHWTRVASANAGSGDNWLGSVAAPAGTTQAWATGASAAGTLAEHSAG